MKYKTWWLAVSLCVALATAAVCSLEWYWRSLGYSARLVDSKELWSVQRDKIAGLGSRALVFVGASRTLFGIDMAVFREELPDYEPVMLAINGHYPLAMLGDLARDPAFKGTVIVDVDSRGLAKVNHAMQQDYIDYYANSWTLSLSAHRRLLDFWQSYMVVAGPEFGAVKVFLRKVDAAPLPWKPNFSTDRDRNSALEFEGVDGLALANSFAHGLAADLAANPPPAPEQWLADLAPVKEWVASIRRRGGHVVFYVPPVRGRQYALAEAAYPRQRYWDAFIEAYGVQGFQAEDVEGMQAVALQDESHMRREDKPAYSRLLIRALLARGYVKAAARP